MLFEFHKSVLTFYRIKNLLKVYTHRCFFADRMAMVYEDLLPWIQERKCDMQMSMVNAAVEQKNFSVAEMLLGKIDEVNETYFVSN